MLNSKVIDYINFILRASEFKDCSSEKVFLLSSMEVYMISNIRLRLTEKKFLYMYLLFTELTEFIIRRWFLLFAILSHNSL